MLRGVVFFMIDGHMRKADNQYIEKATCCNRLDDKQQQQQTEVHAVFLVSKLSLCFKVIMYNSSTSS